MKIAVTGLPGGLVRDRLVSLGIEPIDADITDVDAVYNAVYNILPDVVIHAAAMTDVDKCELDYRRASQVNVRGTLNVVEACNNVNSRMIYLSTCHVFDGTNPNPYPETYRTNPKNVYGFSKWEGEVLVHSLANKFVIVRISKLFTSEKFRKYVENPQEIVVPTFMVRNYTHVNHFCDMLLDLVRRPFYGNKFLINLSAFEKMDSYKFYREMYTALGIDSRLVHPRFDEERAYVPRPYNGALDMSLAKKSNVLLHLSISNGIDLVKDELGI